MIENFYSRSCIVGNVVVLDVDPVIGTVLRFDVYRREVDLAGGRYVGNGVIDERHVRVVIDVVRGRPYPGSWRRQSTRSSRPPRLMLPDQATNQLPRSCHASTAG